MQKFALTIPALLFTFGSAQSGEIPSVTLLSKIEQTILSDATCKKQGLIQTQSEVKVCFSKNETVKTIMLSDSKKWDVLVVNKENMLVVKPMEKRARGTMQVLTQTKSGKIFSYQFALASASS